MKKQWKGWKARPNNRAKTWGRDQKPRENRREVKRDLKRSRFSLQLSSAVVFR